MNKDKLSGQKVLRLVGLQILAGLVMIGALVLGILFTQAAVLFAILMAAGFIGMVVVALRATLLYTESKLHTSAPVQKAEVKE